MNPQTPYIKFHPEILKKNYQTFNKICKELFPHHKICFSVKTNTNSLTINTLKRLNSGFEVASLREIKLTPKSAFKVMNGPAKTTEELKKAIKQKILIQIDSFSEIEKLSKLKTKPKEAIIRISENSKFGFSPNQISEAIKKLKENKIELAGFQIHKGTLNKFSEFSKNLQEQKKIIQPHLNKIKYLNFGGGFPDNFQLKNFSLNLKDYLKEIKETFKNFQGTFIFEPGRNLVADSYTLITKVISIKEKDNETYAILDAGINILSKITLANFKFNKISNQEIKLSKRSKDNNKTGGVIAGNTDGKSKEKPKTYILAGPLLFNNDLLGKWNGKLKEEDLFEIENIGAYCENLAWNIIYEKPSRIQ